MTLDYNGIVAELNAGRIVFLYKDGKTIVISKISEIPGDLSGAGYVRTFGQYPVQGTPTNGQTLIFNTDHFEYGTISAGASSWSALTGKPTDLVTIAGLTPVDDDFLQRKAGAWVNRTVAQVKTDLGAIAVGDSPTVTGQWTYAAGSITTSKPLSVTQTWNAVGTTFNSLLVNVTDTASAAGSLLADFQVGGNSKLNIGKTGSITITGATSNDRFLIGGTTNLTISAFSNSLGAHYQFIGDTTGYGGPAQLKFGAGAFVTWQSTNRADSGSTDLGILRHTANILRVTNGSTGAGKLLLGTSSDTSSAQLDVRSQATGTPAGQFQAASGESASATVLSVKDGSGTEVFKVTPKGIRLPAFGSTTSDLLLSRSDEATGISSRGNGQLNFYASGVLIGGFSNTQFEVQQIGFSSGSFGAGAGNALLRYVAAANLAFGAADANPPVAQTLSVQNASGSNIAGANWTFNGSRGTGTGAGGNIIFQTAPLGSTGSALNALVAQLTVKNTGGILVSDSGISLGRTITASGTTGAQTINKSAGTVNAAASATSIVVTNSLVTVDSLVFCQIRTDDATAAIKSVVPAAGSFTINLTAPTAETSIGFMVVN